MSNTRRRLFSTDENGQLYMYGTDSPYTTAGDLKDHGLDVPAELVDAYEEAVRAWEETQKRLQAWFDGVAPSEAESLQRDIFDSVALYWQRTWDQYDAFRSCDHAEAVEQLNLEDKLNSQCRRCGSYVAQVVRVYNEETRQWEDLDPPYEVKVWA